MPRACGGSCGRPEPARAWSTSGASATGYLASNAAGVACEAGLEAAVALPPRPSKPGFGIWLNRTRPWTFGLSLEDVQQLLKDVDRGRVRLSHNRRRHRRDLLQLAAGVEVGDRIRCRRVAGDPGACERVRGHGRVAASIEQRADRDRLCLQQGRVRLLERFLESLDLDLQRSDLSGHFAWTRRRRRRGNRERQRECDCKKGWECPP